MREICIVLPWGMLFRRFYCHKCGARLRRFKKNRTVTPCDEDYEKYSSSFSGGKITIYTTNEDINVTEYDFKCPCCENVTKYSEQCVIRKIQKKQGKSLLETSELDELRAWAEDRVSTVKMIREMLWVGLIIACIIISFFV